MNFKTTLIALLCPLFMFSQNISDKKREKIESQKIAFITNQLDLTSEEAQVFWPVYNEFSKEMKSLHNEKKENSKEIRKNIENMSDSEIAKVLEKIFVIEQKELDVKKKYNLKFQKILSTQKVAKLYRAEREFKKELLNRIRKGGEKPNHKKR
ncbi:MAG: hypothetical protein HOH88_03360 [Flavobacteriales bacterium]|jgi:hypothetical protein|nr:hypothetical protein [Flavobacteriales bacterium]